MDTLSPEQTHFYQFDGCEPTFVSEGELRDHLQAYANVGLRDVGYGTREAGLIGHFAAEADFNAGLIGRFATEKDFRDWRAHALGEFSEPVLRIICEELCKKLEDAFDTIDCETSLVTKVHPRESSKLGAAYFQVGTSAVIPLRQPAGEWIYSVLSSIDRASLHKNVTSPLEALKEAMTLAMIRQVRETVDSAVDCAYDLGQRETRIEEIRKVVGKLLPRFKTPPEAIRWSGWYSSTGRGGSDSEGWQADGVIARGGARVIVSLSVGLRSKRFSFSMNPAGETPTYAQAVVQDWSEGEVTRALGEMEGELWAAAGHESVDEASFRDGHWELARRVWECSKQASRPTTIAEALEDEPRAEVVAAMRALGFASSSEFVRAIPSLVAKAVVVVPDQMPIAPPPVRSPGTAPRP